MPDAIIHRPAQPAFSARMEELALELLSPLKPVTEAVRRTQKFKQIATSVREIGVVEPLVVAPDRKDVGRFIVLDGNIRLEVLKESGETSALCLIATDDEGYTYNNRINRLAIIQEHRMILKAIERGVSEDRLAAVLSVNTDNIRRKRRLLDGICADAASLLEDKHVSINSFDALRKVLPERQVEAAELMVAMNKYTVSYARTLLAATPEAQLVPGKRRGVGKGVTEEQLALMQRESAGLDREFRLVDGSLIRTASCPHGDPDPEARGPQETPHGGANQARWWGWRRTRTEPTLAGSHSASPVSGVCSAH